MNPKAETLYTLLNEAKQANQGQLTRELWLNVAQKFLDSIATQRTKTIATGLRAELPEADWIAYLESLPHLQGIDVKREIGKCQLWTTTNKGVPPTRKRIINWLLKVERPVTQSYRGHSSAANQRDYQLEQGLAEPQGWREAFPDCIYDTWQAVPADSKRHIIKSLNP